MKVQRGNAKPKRVTRDKAAEAVHSFLRDECGVNIEYIRFCENGEIQLKTHAGLKVVFCPAERKVIFC